MSSRRTLVRIFLAVVVVAGPAVVTSPAHAVTTYTRHFSVTKAKFLDTVNRCVQVTISGDVKFQVEAHDSYTGTYTHRRIVSPSMQIETFATCSAPPFRTPKTVKQMNFHHDYSSSTCANGVDISLSGGISLGIFSVGVGASSACSEQANLGKFDWTSPQGADANKTMYNTDSVVHIDDENWAPIAYAWPYGGGGASEPDRFQLCIPINFTARVTTSDSDHYTGSAKPCVKYW